MAEFPELGQRCAFEHCKQLDFLPFNCSQCEQDYCTDHRLPHAHSCRSEEADNSRLTCATGKTAKPFCCSYASCANAEFVKIVCPHCELNYCLAHRHCSDHECADDPSATQRPSASSVQRPQPPSKIASTQPETTKSSSKASTSTKVLSAAEQQRVDRVTLMKLKMKAGGSDKNAIPDSERLFLLVILPDSTEKVAVLVSKKWTVGRCFDQVIKLFNVNKNCDSNSKKLCLYIQHCSEAMNMSANISDAGAVEGSTLELRHE